MADFPTLREEIKEVLRCHPHTFIYFCDPVTRIERKTRDYAIGVYNYMLDVHVFMMNDRGATFGTIFACYGPLMQGYWHAFKENDGADYEFCRLFTEQFRDVRVAFAELMHDETNNADDR